MGGEGGGVALDDDVVDKVVVVDAVDVDVAVVGVVVVVARVVVAASFFARVVFAVDDVDGVAFVDERDVEAFVVDDVVVDDVRATDALLASPTLLLRESASFRKAKSSSSFGLR